MLSYILIIEYLERKEKKWQKIYLLTNFTTGFKIVKLGHNMIFVRQMYSSRTTSLKTLYAYGFIMYLFLIVSIRIAQSRFYI